jgi:hypothetical protein
MSTVDSSAWREQSIGQVRLLTVVVATCARKAGEVNGNYAAISEVSNWKVSWS